MDANTRKRMEEAGFGVYDTPEELFEAMWPELKALREQKNCNCDCCDEQEGEQTCPHCESKDIKEEMKQDTVISGNKATTVSIPVFVCQDKKCNYMWTDYRAEDIRTTALQELKERWER